MKTRAATFVRERLVRPLLPDGITTDLNRNDRIGALHRAWGYVFTSQIQGAYYECGVYQGETFRASRRVYQRFFRWQQSQRTAQEAWRRAAADGYAAYRHHFYAFDTFRGIPENTEGNPVFRAGAFACSREAFARRNRAAGIVEGPAVRYFQGTFAEIAETQREAVSALQPAAIVNIDCDLYRSACEALDLVAPKLVQGTVLLLDDWNTFAARQEAGERRALREFAGRHPQVVVEPWFAYEYTGHAFLVHRVPGAG